MDNLLGRLELPEPPSTTTSSGRWLYIQTPGKEGWGEVGVEVLEEGQKEVGLVTTKNPPKRKHSIFRMMELKHF